MIAVDARTPCKELQKIAFWKEVPTSNELDRSHDFRCKMAQQLPGPYIKVNSLCHLCERVRAETFLMVLPLSLYLRSCMLNSAT